MMRRYLTFFLVMFAVFSVYFYFADPPADSAERSAVSAGEQHPWITVPFFGRVKQEKSEVATRAYEAAQYAVSYPADWQATQTARGGGPAVDFGDSSQSAGGTSPKFTDRVGFGPAGGSVAHEILVSPQTPAEVKSAIVGQTGSEERVALPAGEALKLSFGSVRDSDAVTYYIFGQGPVVVLRILGPGNQALDQAARIMLTTLRLK